MATNADETAGNTLKIKMKVIRMEDVGDNRVEIVLEGLTPRDKREFPLVFDNKDTRIHEYKIGQTVNVNLTPKPLIAISK